MRICDYCEHTAPEKEGSIIYDGFGFDVLWVCANCSSHFPETSRQGPNERYYDNRPDHNPFWNNSIAGAEYTEWEEFKQLAQNESMEITAWCSCMTKSSSCQSRTPT